MAGVFFLLLPVKKNGKVKGKAAEGAEAGEEYRLLCNEGAVFRDPAEGSQGGGKYFRLYATGGEFDYYISAGYSMNPLFEDIIR